MAEFLIYNKEHWSKKRPELAKKFPDRFGAVHEKGDIVEVRPDGFWAKRGWNKDAFDVVKKPRLSFEKYKCLMKSVESETLTAKGEPIMTFRRRGKIVSGNLIDKTGEING